MINSQPIFIIGSGRSGTTLIQRILNSYPEIIIWGEHDGFLKDIAKAYFHLKNSASMEEFSYRKTAQIDKKPLTAFKDPNVWQAWNNWFLPSDLGNVFRNIVESILRPKMDKLPAIWGFKEIRYYNDDVIEFLQELYPDATYIFIVRDGLNVIESQLTTFYQGESNYLTLKRLQQLPKLIEISLGWTKANNYYFNLSEINANCHFLKYEDVITDISALTPLLEKYNLTISKAQNDILDLKDGRGSPFSNDLAQSHRWKRLGVIPAFIAETIIGDSCKRFSYERPNKLLTATRISTYLTKFKSSKTIRKTTDV